MTKRKKSKKKASTQQIQNVPGNVQLSINRVPRNPYANHPMMSKGGVHQKSKSALRSSARRETKKMARDWASLIIRTIDCFKLLYI